MMAAARTCQRLWIVAAVCWGLPATGRRCQAQGDASLPAPVKAVWDLAKAYRRSTATRERVCINGLWRWQPAGDTAGSVPAGGWGFFKVPGCWPGIADYMQKDCQTVHAHPRWKNEDLGDIAAAWHQREITIPGEWAGRRIAVRAEYLNSYAVVYVDGRKAGEMRFPSGEVDLTPLCRPGRKHVLSMLVVAMPLKGVMLSYNDTASARKVKGSVRRRGLCGDVWLVAEPSAARIVDVKVDTSVRKGEITFDVAPRGLAAKGGYALRARITESGRGVGEFTSKAFKRGDLGDGRIAFTGKWKPDRLWDTHTPGNTYDVGLSLLDAGGKVLDAALPVRFGFREFWIDGRDFHLNGTRIFLSAVPLDNAQVGAAPATYEGAKESLLRLKSFGINMVYTHNYGCQPGSHLSFAEVLKAADDVGMLVSLSQPHFSHYDWKAPDAEKSNGYARHAAFYVRVAQNHPSVVAYATSHNATASGQDMNPDFFGDAEIPREGWSLNNTRRALRAEAVIKGLDPSRVVYHHAGDIASLHASNFYPNFVPVQEMSDWFEHWATQGVKPAFLCEYGAPFSWDWAMYRGWYQGHREFGSARVPWEFCLAEWNAQFLGDRAFRISEMEKANLRWEAKQFRAGNVWHRWDYPHVLGSRLFDERHPVLAMYITDNWRAFRTWGLSANSPWEHRLLYKLRDGVDKGRRELPVDWAKLQRPGLSPDYEDDRYERMDLAFKRSDWVATPSGQAILRNNAPVLAYLAGKPGRFTSKDHNFLPGETVEKQIVVINNSREPAVCDCTWSLGLPQPVRGEKQVRVHTGRQVRVPLRFDLPAGLAPGAYRLDMTAGFNKAEPQRDSFTVHVLARPARPALPGKVALFDPRGQTGKLLAAMGVRCQSVAAGADLSGFDALIIGKAALTADGPAPDVARVRDGLRVLVFEQTAEALEKRLGFRVQEYGLRNVFKRVPDHPSLAGLDDEHLRDWRGEAALLPPRLKPTESRKYGSVPTVRRSGLEVPRLWRCGNRGSVASVLIEKPACGDFLPVVDGGFSLQYSPLLEYREGRGMVMFCQMDVTGRTEADPAAGRLVRGLLGCVSSWKPAPRRRALYVGDPAGRAHLASAGVSPGTYEGGELSGEQVLVVAPGGGKALRPHAPDIARWLKAGGHLLALELDGAEASTFLPEPLRTTKREHIAAWFQAFGVGSLLAGVGPADVHNRDPRELPLVSGGAAVVGNGVLAKAEKANVVFCQLAPHRVSKARGAVPSLAVSADDAVAGKQSALLTMGSVPWGQFGQKVQAGKVGKTYTFAVFVKGVGQPVRVRLEVERAGRPWDRAVRGEDVEVPADDWTELHVTFKVTRPCPEGWSAYIHCGQEGARLRADLFQLREGGYVRRRPGARAAAAAGGGDLFANASFEAGTKPWWFNWKVQRHNVRRTYRRASFLVTRLLANMQVAGKTPLLRRFATPISGAPRESVARNGDFSLDKDDDGMPDHWQFSSTSKQATCVLEKAAPGTGGRALRITCPGFGEGKKGSVMLAQHDVPMTEGQWYRISLKARSEGFKGARVDLAVQDTTTWRSLIEYQRFSPGSQWREFTFLVPAKATATSRTRFQVWHGGAGTLWISNVRVAPCSAPSRGRWLTGLYLDRPVEWDDPYRFFRW